MATIALSTQEISYLRTLVSQGANNQSKISEAWAFLGARGDSYAYLAAKVVTDNTSSMGVIQRLFYEMVRLQWDNTVGTGVWGTQVFRNVGVQHLNQYIRLLELSTNGSIATLPNTLEIEASYRNALIDNGLPPQTAIDSLLSVIETEMSLKKSWADIMSLGNEMNGEPAWPVDRVIYNSMVFVGDLDPADAAIQIGRLIVDAAAIVPITAMPTALQPLYWIVEAADSILDFSAEDFGYRYALLGIGNRLGLKATETDLLLANSASNGRAAFSTLLDKIAKITVGDLPASAANRIQIFLNAAQINTWLKGNGSTMSIKLIGPSSSDLIANASSEGSEGIAYRYALASLNPFVLLGANYDTHNQSGSLDLYSPQTSQGTLSQEWITDRSAMLLWLNKLNLEDKNTSAANPYNPTGSNTPRQYFYDIG